jgi:sugar phosphate isomerase/epimerase
MRFSLSGRLIETTSTSYTMDWPAFVDLARHAGYDAVNPRDGQIDPALRCNRPDELLRTLADAVLTISLVWGRLDRGPIEPRVFKDKLVFLEAGGGDVMVIGYPQDVERVREYCDLSAGTSVSLAIACHINSPFEDLAAATAFVREVARPNIGLAVDPANLHLAGRYPELAQLHEAAPFISMVQLQGCVLAPDGPLRCKRFYERRTVAFSRVPLLEQDAIDIRQFMADLRQIGYDGVVNVNEPYLPDREALELATGTARMLRGYLDE